MFTFLHQEHLSWLLDDLWLAVPARERTAAARGAQESGVVVKKIRFGLFVFEIPVLDFWFYHSRAPACRPLGTLVGPRCVLAVCPASADPPFQYVNL